MKFVHIAAHLFQPKHKFDVVVFSEVLYYVEYMKVIDQYLSHLNPHGVMIISIFHPDPDKILYENIFEYARNVSKLVDFIDIMGSTKKSENTDRIKTSFRIEVYRKL